MRKDLIRGALAVLAFTVLLGLAFPLLITGIAQVAFPGKADGDRSLVARPPRGPGDFVPRPSQTGYSATGTAFANRGPNQRATADLTRQHLRAYLARERRYVPGLTARDVPQDAATFSASGIDPHISPANARIQAHRVAAVRHLPLDKVMKLVDEHTDGRALGLFGEPGVNVADLDAALDQEA
ncbi:MAG: potassium-transporting ATPase subunit C [Solirubrobacterales bacterium]|nr:potassium-transporting ATPase subunit C [Solirubrobacterales bacterium]